MGAPDLFPQEEAMFKRDPLVRFPHDPAPYIPGSLVRYHWCDDFDEDVALLRENLQEQGKGLYVLRWGEDKVVAEAYYPEDIRPEFFKLELDPYRQDDYRRGRLVVVGYPLNRGGDPQKVGCDGLRPILTVLRRGNRNSRQALRRSYNPSQWLREAREVERQEFDKADRESGFSDYYVDAWKETRNILKPKSYGGL